MNMHFVQSDKGKVMVMIVDTDDIFTRLGESPSIPMADDTLDDIHAVVVKLKHRKVTLFQSAKIIKKKGALLKSRRHFAIQEWQTQDKGWVTKFYKDQQAGKLKRGDSE